MTLWFKLICTAAISFQWRRINMYSKWGYIKCFHWWLTVNGMYHIMNIMNIIYIRDSQRDVYLKFKNSYFKTQFLKKGTGGILLFVWKLSYSLVTTEGLNAICRRTAVGTFVFVIVVFLFRYIICTNGYKSSEYAIFFFFLLFCNIII